MVEQPLRRLCDFGDRFVEDLEVVGGRLGEPRDLADKLTSSSFDFLSWRQLGSIS
jgi:hypothetical protein